MLVLLSETRLSNGLTIILDSVMIRACNYRIIGLYNCKNVDWPTNQLFFGGL
jgi:hypothetical protein